MKPGNPVVQFLVVFVWVTALITSVGAILGAAIWPLVGLALGSRHEPWQLALTGVRTLGFYFFIWAPGTGIVIASIREWRRQHPES
ncbi:MAG: hypothetical protein IPL39_02645 [Opitutaceae bacterium]|nr:hypothetical protein [Opitutaceae bacterium]